MFLANTQKARVETRVQPVSNSVSFFSHKKTVVYQGNPGFPNPYEHYEPMPHLKKLWFAWSGVQNEKAHEFQLKTSVYNRYLVFVAAPFVLHAYRL